MTATKTNASLQDAMYALSLAKRVPDAELLDEFVRQYPQHADALTEFAIELTRDAMLEGDEELEHARRCRTPSARPCRAR